MKVSPACRRLRQSQSKPSRTSAPPSTRATLRTYLCRGKKDINNSDNNNENEKGNKDKVNVEIRVVIGQQNKKRSLQFTMQHPGPQSPHQRRGAFFSGFQKTSRPNATYGVIRTDTFTSGADQFLGVQYPDGHGGGRFACQVLLIVLIVGCGEK